MIRYVLPVPPLCSPFLCLSRVRSPLLSFFTVCSSSIDVPIVLLFSLSQSPDPSYNNLLLFFALIPSACSWASRIRYCACGCVNHFENCRQSEVRLQLAILLASFFPNHFFSGSKVSSNVTFAVLRMTVSGTASLICLRPQFLYVSCQLRVGQSSLQAAITVVRSLVRW